jgi:hypothetical protein
MDNSDQMCKYGAIGNKIKGKLEAQAVLANLATYLHLSVDETFNRSSGPCYSCCCRLHTDIVSGMYTSGE